VYASVTVRPAGALALPLRGAALRGAGAPSPADLPGVDTPSRVDFRGAGAGTPSPVDVPDTAPPAEAGGSGTGGVSFVPARAERSEAAPADAAEPRPLPDACDAERPRTGLSMTNSGAGRGRTADGPAAGGDTAVLRAAPLGAIRRSPGEKGSSSRPNRTTTQSSDCAGSVSATTWPICPAICPAAAVNSTRGRRPAASPSWIDCNSSVLSPRTPVRAAIANPSSLRTSV
jgi:hypothetical protein